MASASRVRERRVARGLTQIELASRVALSRQALGAIEAGRAEPSVDVALRIARTLDATVEDLFGSGTSERLLATESDSPRVSERVALAHIAGRWISYPLLYDAVWNAADGIVQRRRGARAWVEPIRPSAELEDNLVLMGCAGALGLLASRLNATRGAGRFSWFPSSSTAALAALAARRTHVAGVHLLDPRSGQANVADVRRIRHTEPITLITLGCWEAGLVVRPEAAGAIRSVRDLARPGIRVAGREPGAGARRLLEHSLRGQGLPVALARRTWLRASGHLDVARAVAQGAADTGVATRDAALAFGLEFRVLAEERYDLAVAHSALSDPRLARLLDMLVSAPVRRELSAVGYDVRRAGERVAEVPGA